MLQISGSSLQPWLDLHDDLDNLPSKLPLCHQTPPKDASSDQNLTTINCTDTCHDLLALDTNFGGNNLLTCGLFSSVAALIRSQDLHPTLHEGSPNAYSSRFEDVGLDIYNDTLVLLSSKAISVVLSWELDRVSVGFRIDNFPGSFRRPCNEQDLFPLNWHRFIPTALLAGKISLPIQECISTICAPKQLDEDLAGVGVYSSVFLQLFLAAVLCLAVPLLRRWPVSHLNGKFSRRVQALTVALTEFQKTQCYFITSIHIATLYLGARYFSSGNEQDFMHSGNPNLPWRLALAFCMGGIVPNTLTLWVITHCGRASGHIILLSLLTFILPTVEMGILTAEFRLSIPQSFYQKPKWTESYQKSLEAMCGTSFVGRNQMPYIDVPDFCLAWSIYVYCLLWTGHCVWSYRRKSTPETAYQTNDKFLSRRRSFGENGSDGLTRKLKIGGSVLVMIIWALCFGFIFQLNNEFFRKKALSLSWSFGQIISITFWAPFLVELIYTQYTCVRDEPKDDASSSTQGLDEVGNNHEPQHIPSAGTAFTVC